MLVSRDYARSSREAASSSLFLFRFADLRLSLFSMHAYVC